MANQEHIKRLKQGVDSWNQWRKEHSHIQPDLTKMKLVNVNLSGINFRGAKLSEAQLHFVILRWADLRDADLSKADLTNSDLIGADLENADLHCADLSETNCRRTNFIGANLRKADLMLTNLDNANLLYVRLPGSRLVGASLLQANLRNADLERADLRTANLFGANLSRANLSQADLYHTNIGLTVFGDVDLRQVKNLEAVSHEGPSVIGIDTIYSSEGNIPEIFLRGAGVPDAMIEYARSLVRKPIDFYSCFISYSSKDQDFAERLYADLQSKGVRCWFALEDLKIGDHYHQRIDESIHLYDKLILILSQHSIQSAWVEREVVAAREKEDREQRSVLFPLRLDHTIMDTSKAWAADIRRRWYIGDFTRWKDYEAYRVAFERLLDDLKALEKF